MFDFENESRLTVRRIGLAYRSALAGWCRATLQEPPSKEVFAQII